MCFYGFLFALMAMTFMWPFMLIVGPNNDPRCVYNIEHKFDGCCYT